MSCCKKCGYELTSEIRYCPQCATKVDTPQPPGGAADAFTGTISATATVVVPERADASMDLEPGKEFHGRYTIERKLGAGAMGVVYLAGDKLTGQDVALKLVNPALVHSASARERFLREGMIARDIRHKNVVSVYDVNETGGQFYLVMEYLSGETLRKWLHRILQAGEDVAYAAAEKIIRNVLEGLDAAHASGVVHRDIKPENIMLTGKPEDGDYSLKILDFGIARAIAGGGALTTTSTSTGTALYMAPEQKTAADTVGPPADFYAVTAILYELLLGVAPTGRLTPLTREREGLPPGIDAVIEKGSSSRPRNRFQTAQEYLRTLYEIRDASLYPWDGPIPDATAKAKKVALRNAESIPARGASAQMPPADAGGPVPVPQIISATGRPQTELQVWSNTPPEELQQRVWQALQAFGVKGLQNDAQSHVIRGETGLTWKSVGQRISAKIDTATGGSTVTITDRTAGPGLADMGRGREEAHGIAGILIQNLTASGRKAYIVRESCRSFPIWLVILLMLILFSLFSALGGSFVEFFDSSL